MKQPIKYVDTLGFQQELDEKFGSGIYKVIWEFDSQEKKQKYIISDIEDQNNLDIILSMVDKHHNESYNKSLEKCINRIDKMAKILIEEYTKFFNVGDYEEAKEWLSDMNQTCPFSIVFFAKKENITNEQAANKMIQEKQKIDDVIKQLNNIRNTTKLQLIDCDNLRLLPSITYDAITHMKELVNVTW